MPQRNKSDEKFLTTNGAHEVQLKPRGLNQNHGFGALSHLAGVVAKSHFICQIGVLLHRYNGICIFFL